MGQEFQNNAAYNQGAEPGPGMPTRNRPDASGSLGGSKAPEQLKPFGIGLFPDRAALFPPGRFQVFFKAAEETVLVQGFGPGKMGQGSLPEQKVKPVFQVIGGKEDPEFIFKDGFEYQDASPGGIIQACQDPHPEFIAEQAGPAFQSPGMGDDPVGEMLSVISSLGN